MVNKIFIAGCGYIGKRVARLEQERGGDVTALSRSDDSRRALEAAGIRSVMGDLDDPSSLERLELAGAICYYFAPPPGKGRADARIRTFLEAVSKASLPKRIVLLSTTSVYGDCKGEWVTEERMPDPQADRAFRRLDAERALEGWAGEHGVEYVILRVAGIYGPGKLPLKRLRDGTPVLSEDEAPYSNRIHADDLARVCRAAADNGGGGEIYNVSDGNPTTMTDYFYSVADALGMPGPRAISMMEAKKELGPGILSYLSESKRIDNSKMLRELGVKLRYAGLKEGLEACLEKK